MLYAACSVVVAVGLASCTVKPEPLSQAAIAEFATSSIENVTKDQEPVAGKIDLYEAMARALKYNLDYKVELMEKALKIKSLDLAHYKMLPDLVAKTGYAGRSNFSGGNSRLLTDKGLFQSKSDLGAESLQSSTSQEKDILSADVQFSWNILDFGLSYVRAKQAADEVLIAEQLKRKVINRVIEDVRTAYWRAVSYERLVHKLRKLDGRVRRALADTRALYNKRETSLITVLTYERELVEIKRELQRLEGDLKVAKSQLAALLNLPPDTRYRLVRAKRYAKSLRLKTPARGLLAKALRNRPELLEIQYRLRINENEADAALLELLPGLQAYAGANYDSNEFLFNQHWLSWGAKASWNLLNLFRYPARKNVVAAQDDLLRQRALAVTMAIMTQVHVSRVRFLQNRKQLLTAAEFYGVQSRLLRQIRTEAQADRVSEQTLIREEMNTLVADVKYDIAYAELHNAFANVYASVGFDPYASGEIDTSLSVRELSKRLRTLWFERGDFSHRRMASN
jgi:outer membrane protein TolC